MAKKELNLGGLLDNVASRVEDATNESGNSQPKQHGNTDNLTLPMVTPVVAPQVQNPYAHAGNNKETNVTTKQQSDIVTKQQSNAEETRRSRSAYTRVKKIVPRTNGCTYYLEDKHIDAIDRIKCFNKVDKQVVVRTALSVFLREYMKEDGMGLTEDGMAEVENYMYE